MTIEAKVAAIRRIMAGLKLDAWVVYGSDPHNSEYVCPRWRTRAFVSGFTGSAGTVMITPTEALLWVDSRYNIQAAREIEGTQYRLFRYQDPGVPSFFEYLQKNKDRLRRIGTSADCLMKAEYDRLVSEGFEVVPTADFLDEIWEDRPPVPGFAVRALDDAICGESAEKKLERIRASLDGADWLFISSLDDIAWTLNLRGRDIEYNPVFLSYLLVGKHKAVLFADRGRFTGELYSKLSRFIEIRPYADVRTVLSTLGGSQKVALDFRRTNMLVYGAFPGNTVFLNRTDCTTEMKACKNPTELEGMRQAHVFDGAALVNLLAQTDRQPSGWTEMKLTDALQSERDAFAQSRGPSFGPIAGFAENGAIVHYSATQESSAEITRGLVVLDTGGHWETGMTDVTRTLVFGEPTDDERRDYTLVLKGHLALYRTCFPAGTTGAQLDVLARQFLWNEGLTYNHGTGHGVGFCLCVHEGPQSISPRGTYPLKPGMVISDEPGVYLEGRHGVRIENLFAVVPKFTTEFGDFYGFEFLTLCPYERRLIDTDLLTEEEIKLVDEYHAQVREKLSPVVRPENLDYLNRATRPLKG